MAQGPGRTPSFDAAQKCNLSPSWGRMLGFLSGGKQGEQKSVCRLVKREGGREGGRGRRRSPLKRHLKLWAEIMTTGNGCLNKM